MQATSAVPPACLGLVAPIARAVQARFRTLTTLAELQQLGAIAAIAAVADLDPVRNEPAQRAYLRLRIRGAMLDPIRRELARREVSFDAELTYKLTADPQLTLDLRRLPPRQRRILELRIQGYTQRETGVACRISQSRVSRIESAAVRTLRRVA